MSEGQFLTVPKIKLNPESIDECIFEGSTYQGGFSVIFPTGSSQKGLCYCDNPYIYVVTPAFNEDNPDISYAILCEHLRAGDLLTGNFHIYSDGQTLLLPFRIEVKKKSLNSSVGIIKTIDDFYELSKRNWKEAYSLFYSDEFYNIIKNDVKISILYRGFYNSLHSDANLEEFLVACGAKPRTNFDIRETSHEVSFLGDNQKETIEITRNTWGYIKIEISTDADFITVENSVVTSSFFLGSKLSINYYIHKDRLHEGKNCCNITFKGMGITKVLTVTVSTRDIHLKKHTQLFAQNQNILKLYNTYEEFRLKRIDAMEWSQKTVKLCEDILNSDYLKDRNFYRLIKTHALIVADNKKMALDMIIRLRSDIEDKRSANWAYLLYLGALLEPSEEYVRRLCNDIESILSDHPEDVRTFWFLLFIKKEFIRSPGAKLRSLKHWINEKYESPILYAECFDIYINDAYQLDIIDDFSVKILNWAIKRKALTKTLADRIMDLINKDESFSNLRFKIYRSAYQKAPSKDHLKTLVSYLLKFGVKGENYASFYKKAIDDNILLTGIFESYIESLPLDYMEPLSDMVLRYYSYGSNISNERKALIYSNIVLYKNENPNIYEANRYKIHQFCIEQMKVGRIDDNLTVCYQDILDSGLVDSKLANEIFKVLFAKKIICLNPLAKRVIVIEEELQNPLASSFNNHIAFIPVYTRDYKIFIEMFDGTLSTDENIYYVENVLESAHVYDKLKFLTTDTAGIFYHDFSQMESSDELSDIYEEQAKKVLFSDVFNEEYVVKKFHIFMGYFREKGQEEVLLVSLLHKERFRFFDSGMIAYMVSLLIEANEDKRALDVLLNYIVPKPDLKALLPLLKRVTNNPSVSRGEFVLELCIMLLRAGYQSDETVEYLLHHFIGTTEDMRLIYKYANPDSPAFLPFIERFLIQSLYTNNILPKDDDIMISYLESNANPMIVEAYISYFCHMYLTKDMTPPQSVFAILFRQLRVTDNINDCCRFAYSKYLCQKEELSHQERENLTMLIDDQLQRNIYFSFYKFMEEDLITKYNIYDRVYVEVKATPKKDIVLEYEVDNRRFVVDLVESYMGIYVKDMVTFFGENIVYKVYDRNDKDTIIATGELAYTDVGQLNESRFYLLNNMHQKLYYKETEGLIEDIVDYNNKLNAQEEIFKLL